MKHISHVFRRVAAAAVAIAASVSLAACGSSSNSAGGGAPSGEVTIFNGATGTINENFNPFSPTALQPTLGVIYEPLYWYNLAKVSKPVPRLATGYKWNKAGNVLTITTRKGVKWSDGKPFTARDVAFTWELMRKTPALNTNGKAAAGKYIDDTHAQIIFQGKNNFIQQDNLLGNQAIVPEHIWKNVKNPTAFINKNPVGTGPFKLSSFTNQSYRLVRNDLYWGMMPKIKSVRYISLADADGATNALLAGKVDWMSAFIPKLDKLIKANKNLSYVNTPQLTTVIMTCSNPAKGCKGPQTDKSVRQAMYYAMDRSQLNRLAGSGFGMKSSPTLMAPHIQGNYIANKKYEYTPQTADVEKAKQILDADGWKVGSDGIREKNGQKLRMTIQTVSGWSDFISINDTLRQQYKKIGLDLQTTQLAWNEWNDKEQKGNFELSLDSFGPGTTPDPWLVYAPKYTTEYIQPVGKTGGQNLARYSNATVDAAVKRLGETPASQTASRLKDLAVIQNQIVEDIPYIPVYVNSCLTEFNNSKVTGFPTNDNKYAFAASWKGWDQGIVLEHLRPVRK